MVFQSLHWVNKWTLRKHSEILEWAVLLAEDCHFVCMRVFETSGQWEQILCFTWSNSTAFSIYLYYFQRPVKDL